MSTDLSNSLAGLSLISGTNAFSTSGTPPVIESKAARVAKAQFTTPVTTPPWKATPGKQSASVQLSAIKAMRTIIDKPTTGAGALPSDVQTSFTAYKALDRLRVLAESAAAKTSSASQRAALNDVFARGLADLQAFLVQVSNGVLDLSFARPARSATSVGVPAPDLYATKNAAVATSRSDPLAGLSGQEQFQITLDKPGANDVVTVDLSAGPQPPTLDSVADAMNAAIAAISLRNPDGSVRLDDNGQPQPRWLVRFLPDRSTGKWGLTLNTPNSKERLTIDQIDAKPAIVVATGQTGPVPTVPGQVPTPGQVPAMTPTATQVFRFDDPAAAMTRKAMAQISGDDRIGTEQAKIAGRTTSSTTTFTTNAAGVKTATTTKITAVQAATDAAAVTVDAQGNSYVVGTTRGDLGANRSNGSDTLFLTKLDGAGKVVWQRGLGAAGASNGAAITLADNGDVVVAGTVTGALDGVKHDGDMIVARYSAIGDAVFTTVVPEAGADSAKAVVVAADGTVFVGGKRASGSGDAFIARIGADGKIAERRTIDGGAADSLSALAIGGDGNLLALINQGGTAQLRKIDAGALASDLATLDLGTADARVLAVDTDGTIAVGGATRAALAGTQVNAPSSGRDGFVARVDAGLGGAAVTYIGGAEEDQVDSVAFLDGAIYAGGRTSGVLGDARTGTVDGFVTRIDGASGAIESTTQFGQNGQTTQPVRIAIATHGANALGALGLASGTVNPEVSAKLATLTPLRPGDFFSLRVDGGAPKIITITADDTLKSLSDRVAKVIGKGGSVSTPRSKGLRSLRIDAAAGHAIDLLPGGTDRDALAKLGFAPQRIETPAALPASAPKVRPGGTFGLNLTTALSLATPEDAKAALGVITQAASTTQTAYRSLYWDDSKASLVDGPKNGGKGASTVREKAQLAGYRSALARLTPLASNAATPANFLFGV